MLVSQQPGHGRENREAGEASRIDAAARQRATTEAALLHFGDCNSGESAHLAAVLSA